MIFAGAYVLGCGNLKGEPAAALKFGKVSMAHALLMGNAEKIRSSAKLLAVASHKTGNHADRDVFSAFWVKVNNADCTDNWVQFDILNPVMEKLGNRAFGRNGANAIWRSKHERHTLQRTISLLPEIVARVGVNIAASGPA